MKVENAVKVEPVGEFELKGIRRPLAAYKSWSLPHPQPDLSRTPQNIAALTVPAGPP